MSDLVERDRRLLWHPYTQMQTAPLPLPIVRGRGVWLELEDGRRVLDGISSWWVNIHGHSHPKLNEAVARQAAELEHVLFAGCTHPPAVDLAEALLGILPSGLTRVFYSDNGSTAVEVALKMALQFWRNRGQPRSSFVALHHAYHGDTVGAMSASDPSPFTRAFGDLLFDVLRAQSPYCRDHCAPDVADLETVLREHHAHVAAVIIEPMLQGAGGMIVWPAGFLADVRSLCDRYDTLLIADEVLTGFGRTGRMFACEHAGITPDLICLSKGLTGGYLPLAVTATTTAVYDAFLSDDRSKAFFHGHSYTANPLACAVAKASLDLFASGELLDRVRRLEAQLRQRLEPLRDRPYVADVRVIGGVGAIELVGPEGEGYLAGIGPRLAAEFLGRGLLLRPLGNIVYFMPPYVITDEEVDESLEIIGEVLEKVL